MKPNLDTAARVLARELHDAFTAAGLEAIVETDSTRLITITIRRLEVAQELARVLAGPRIPREPTEAEIAGAERLLSEVERDRQAAAEIMARCRAAGVDVSYCARAEEVLAAISEQRPLLLEEAMPDGTPIGERLRELAREECGPIEDVSIEEVERELGGERFSGIPKHQEEWNRKVAESIIASYNPKKGEV